MLKTPGLYIVSTLGSLHMGYVEVEANGTCHQLAPDTLARDGVLRPDGWHPQTVVLPYSEPRRK